MGNNKYCIALDWLEIILTGEISILEDVKRDNSEFDLGNGIILKHTNTMNHIGFRQSLLVFLDRESIGYLHYGNNLKMKFKSPKSNLLHINNHILYQKDLPGKINRLQKGLGLNFSHFYRVDIAIDGMGLISSFNHLMDSKTLSKKSAVKIHGDIDHKTKKHTRFTIGSRKSEKYISLYNKTLEIEDKGKWYIKEFWNENGLNENSIDRLELRLNAKALKSFNPDFEYLLNPNYLAGYFKLNAGDWLEFIHVKNKKMKNFIDWSKFEKTEIIKLAKTTATNNLVSKKTTIKVLYEELMISKDESYLKCINILCAKYQLENWAKSKVNRWNASIPMLFQN
ncbi:MAG: replication initiation factor domain-containing protein [Burkholderiales bacterium]|nr:replication initiation factor domain-containing protein [Bacteroidia bacterium]